MKNATYRHFGWKTAGWIFLLMLICAILCGSAWAENEIQISAAERQYMENGIDLMLSNVPESGDFAVSVRSPMHIVELIESWNFEIRVARENGEFSFSLETGGVVSFSYLTYPYPVGLSSAYNENGDLLLHIDLEEDSIRLAGTEWPMETVVWEEEFRSHRKGRTVGSFVLLRYPEGISAPEHQDLMGGWKVLSSSDGQSYDDFWFDQNEILFRRHDANGDPYYAPRRITKSRAPFYAGDHFTWRILNENGTYVLTNEEGVKLVCQKTDETADDFRLSYLTGATPPFATLFGHEWHFWDSDLMFVSDSFWRFYEDVVVYSPNHHSAIEDTYATEIRYEADHLMRFKDNGEKETLYEWSTYGTGGWVSLYTYQIKDGIKGSRRENRAYVPDGSMLAPAPTAEPTREPLPSPAPVNASLFRNMQIDSFGPNSVHAMSGNKDKLSDGFKTAKEVTALLNQICSLTFDKANSVMYIRNTESDPVRFCFYVHNPSDQNETRIRFFNGSRDCLADVPLGSGSKDIQLVYSAAVQPGDALYFNFICKDTRYSHSYRVMICRESYADFMLADAYTCQPAEQTDAAVPTPTPKPTPKPTQPAPESTVKPRSSISFTGTAPDSSFANYSTEEMPRFRVTLWSDGTGELEEHFMEEAGFYPILWSWEGNTLCTQDSTASLLYTVFQNGTGTYDFYGSGVQVELPAGAEDFFLEAIGYVPEGVTAAPSDSGPDKPESAAAAGTAAVSAASEGLIWPAVYYNFSANRQYYYSSEDYYEGETLYDKPAFAFYDLDGDGDQEMLGFNGYSSHADAACYAYTYEGEMISCLGIAGGEPGCFYYLEQDQYPGIFFHDGGMGYYHDDYITVKNGKLVRETVFETEEGNGNRKTIQKTADDALFRLASSDAERHALSFITAEELLEMGWDRYLTEVLHLYTDSAQTENINPAAVWEETNTEGTDPAAVWENQDTENIDPAAVWESAFTMIPGTDGLKQIPVQNVTATSYIGEKKGDDTYAPFRMIDGLEETSFQFRTSETKLGKEYLYFTFAQPVMIDELWIKNGFWRYTDGYDQYVRNSRVKVMTVDYLYEGRSDYSDAEKITLKDDKKRKDWIKLNLGPKEKVTSVRFLIQKIYQGSKFKKDVCISEVMFVQK